MNKKTIMIIIAIVAAVAILFAAAWFGFKSLFNEKEPGNQQYIKSDAIVTVESVTVTQEETISIPVKINNNPGIMAMMLEFEYDSNILEYKGYEEGTVFTDYEIGEKEGSIKVVSVEENDVAKDGEIIILNFEILDTGISTTEVKALVKDNSFCNYDEKYILTTAVNGTITINKH